MKGGKLHHRQKRTIGDIINWKLNLLQSIFGGITGLFGGGKKPGGRPSYGPRPQRPSRPGRPSYGGNTQQRPQRPSYGGGGGRPQGRPQGRPRPNYGGQGGQGGGGGQVFGPASVFHMLPAPNLATEAPQVSFTCTHFRHEVCHKSLSSNLKCWVWLQIDLKQGSNLKVDFNQVGGLKKC